MSVFNYLDYIDVLRWQIRENRDVYGYKKQLALVAGCQPSLLSQVLNRAAFLNSDHGLALCGYWNFSELETEYFLALIQLARAGSSQLQDYQRKKLARLKRESEDLSKRYTSASVAGDAASAAIYYSSWIYTATHILLTIPAFQTVEAIATRLRLSTAKVRETLQVLEQLGLARNEGRLWTTGDSNIHLEKRSPISQLHHHHWRQRSIVAYSEKPQDMLAYSALYSMSRADLEQLKEMAFGFIDKSRSLVEASDPEELVCLVCDLFPVGDTSAIKP